MNEIKVGEYVRTNKGIIATVCAYSDLRIYGDDGREAVFHSYDTDKGSIADVDIKHHSVNIKDLIEADDYVNGHLVEEVYGCDNDGNDTEELGIGVIDGDDGYYETIKNIEIRNIVTHEQFDSMEYVVGG